MNCAETKKILHAYADRELDLAHAIEVEQHLKSCADCAAELKGIQSLGDALRQSPLAHRAPAALRKDIRQMVRAESDSEAPAERRSPEPAIKVWIWKLIAASTTAFAALTILLLPRISGRNDLLSEVVASHVRSLQADHLTDVASSDQHTVKPWFDGKLDFAPDVKDFADKGFPLVGGRLDYINGRTVAALVYRHNKHLINVFVWPMDKTTGLTTKNLHGYSVIEHSANGMHYCFVSDLNSAELSDLAHLIAP